MRNVRLEVVEHEDTGSKGFRPCIFANWPGYIPMIALGHDLIDHTTKENGEVWQELRAFGANLFVSDFGNLERLYTSAGQTNTNYKGQLMGGELESILSDAYANDTVDALKMAPKVSFDSEIEEQFAELWTGYKAAFKSSFADETAIDYFNSYSEEILSWFRYGFKLAAKRFNNDSYQAFTLKERINKTLQQSWKLDDYMIGEKLTLQIDFDNLEVNVKRNYIY